MNCLTLTNYSRLHKSAAILLLAIGLIVNPTFAQPVKSRENQKPNFILILADDLGYGDIGAFGSTRNRTPHLDRMAREGMKLTSFYAAPVCTPSRAQILTGCYAKRVSLPGVLGPASATGISSNELTIAELLKQRGYATMVIGKWHVGDHPDFLPTRHGFDHYFGLPYSNDMGKEDGQLGKGNRPPLPLVRDDKVIEVVKPKDQDQLTERYTDEAVKFIRAQKDHPFFLYLPHTAVHTPIHPGDKFNGKSASPFSDWVEELDWSVGRVLDTVRELKLSERTLVIFTSDNGPWLPKGTNAGTAFPLRGGKGSTWEGGVREPTLAWWPGKVPADSVSDAVAANYDCLPTFVELAGGKVPTDRKIDGRNIAPLLFGHTKTSPHEAHFYFSGNKLQAVRSGPWKLKFAGLGKTDEQTDPAPMLFNLDDEIGEQTDVSAKNPDALQRLQKLIVVMDGDLGVTNSGPGIRPPGRIENPTGLWLPGHGPATKLAP
ncbi:MAG: arylsulfatase [Pedosphaera sp.]|nr:arylsulfatase [Pedosphaera sp.]